MVEKVKRKRKSYHTKDEDNYSCKVVYTADGERLYNILTSPEIVTLYLNSCDNIKELKENKEILRVDIRFEEKKDKIHRSYICELLYNDKTGEQIIMFYVKLCDFRHNTYNDICIKEYAVYEMEHQLPRILEDRFAMFNLIRLLTDNPDTDVVLDGVQIKSLREEIEKDAKKASVKEYPKTTLKKIFEHMKIGKNRTPKIHINGKKIISRKYAKM